MTITIQEKLAEGPHSAEPLALLRGRLRHRPASRAATTRCSGGPGRQRIFVNSMSDPFQDQVPDWFIAQVFARMALAPRHTLQLLTKRHGRMRAVLASPGFRGLMVELTTIAANDYRLDARAATATWPLPNVWVGVSVENQQWADIRIPALRGAARATVHFLSCEPLLGPVSADLSGIDWVIGGGESGHGARPMRVECAPVAPAPVRGRPTCGSS